MEEKQIRLQYDKIKESLVSLITNIGQNPYRLEKIQEKSSLDSKAVEISFEIINNLCNAFEFSISISLEDIIDELRQTQISEKLCEIYRLVSKAGDQGGFLEAIDKGSIPPSNKFEKFLSIIDQQKQTFNFLISLNQQVLKTIENFFSEDRQLFQHAINLLSNHLNTHLLKKKAEFNNQKVEEFANEYEKAKMLFQQIINNIKGKQEDIDRLMADATKLGLAQRYTQEKNILDSEKHKWDSNFRFALYSLIGLGALEIIVFVCSIYIEEMQKISSTPTIYLGLIPIHIAIIWFVIFFSRRRNEANRLASDYAHKEVFASSYKAYQEEIDELKKTYPQKADELTELNTKLLDSMIGVLSDNPAKSLDTKKTTDELPTKELVNFASEIIKLK